MDLRAGYLARYARINNGKKTHSLTTKVTEQEHKDFTEYAAALNLSPSEAIRLLIVEELARVNREIPTDPAVYIAATKEYPADTMRYKSISPDTTEIPGDPLEIPTEPPRRRRYTTPRPSSGGGAGRSANRWKVGGQLPCPICGKWGAATNFKRDHIEKHGLSYENAPQFLQAYEEVANKMVEERKKELGME